MEAVAQAEEALDEFPKLVVAAHRDGLREKLGLTTAAAEDEVPGRDLLDLMAANRADFTFTFRRLSEASADWEKDGDLRAMFADVASFGDGSLAGARAWRRSRAIPPCAATECARRTRRSSGAITGWKPWIRAAVDDDDFTPFHELISVLAQPFKDQPAFAAYTQPPQEHEIVGQTFCGT